MSGKEEYIEIKDIDSIKKALENAEIEYEEVENGGLVVLETDGLDFVFNDDGILVALDVERTRSFN